VFLWPDGSMLGWVVATALYSAYGPLVHGKHENTVVFTDSNTRG